mgnify:CR=1 FL=1
MDDMNSAISAMLDDEPFDAAALAASLETREGRDLLIDLVALRHLVQAPIAAQVPATASPRRPAWRLLAAAAESGARGANGLTMLLHQGAIAFELWFDRPAPMAAMRRALARSE